MNDVEGFKNNLKNYVYYKHKISQLQDEIDYLYHSLTGLAGKGFGESVRNTNQALKEQRRLETLDKIETLEIKKAYYMQQLLTIDRVLDKCSLKNVMIQVYCYKRGYRRLGRELGYTPRGLQKKVDKELEKVLKEI